MAAMNLQPEDGNTVLISQLYNPEVYTEMLPQQGFGEAASKPRRRRRKNKAKEPGAAVGLKKRKLSSEQVNLLEMNFGNEHKLESERKDRLASELGLDPRQVAVWFQNRRARWKNKKLEDEYNTLKKSHDSLVLEKSHLESEMLKLKEQLSEAKREIQQLLERGDGTSSNSPTSSITIDAMQPSTLGEMFVDEYEDVFYYMRENNYNHGMEWLNLYM